jgi:hypothetical protein
VVCSVGIVSTVAGNKGSLTAGSADGVGTLASFNHPHGIVVDSTGINFFIADTGNFAVRVLDITTSKFDGTTMGTGLICDNGCRYRVHAGGEDSWGWNNRWIRDKRPVLQSCGPGSEFGRDSVCLRSSL